MKLLNPLPFDVSTTYDIKGDRSPETFTLPSKKITVFENETIFNHMREYLVEEVLNHRNIIHFDQNREEIRKEIVK